MRETVDTDTKKTVDAITEVFEQARVFEDGNPGVSKKERKKRKTESTTEIVAALRLLSSTYVSLQLLSTTSLKEELDHLLTHDNPAVRAMAQTLKTAWLADLRARVGTLSATCTYMAFPKSRRAPCPENTHQRTKQNRYRETPACAETVLHKRGHRVAAERTRVAQNAGNQVHVGGAFPNQAAQR